MGDLQLKHDSVVQWLLEESNPSVRYHTLRDLLERPETAVEVKQAKVEIERVGLVPAILEKQREAAYQESYRKFYHTKYQGIVWQLIVLAELGATTDTQIREQCEYLFQHAQVVEDGGFAMQTAVKTGGGRASEAIPCLAGNMVWSLIQFGYLNDPRLQAGTQWIVRHTYLNDGDESQEDPQQKNREACWGRHTCFMGVVKPLKALAAIPIKQRTEEVRDAIAQMAEYILIHHIYKRSHDLTKAAKPGWLKFGFPLMYQTDVLEILDILTTLGIRDSRMEDAIALVLDKRGEDGRWRAQNTANNEKLLVPFAREDQDKWVTLRALRVLKFWNGK